MAFKRIIAINFELSPPKACVLRKIDNFGGSILRGFGIFEVIFRVIFKRVFYFSLKLKLRFRRLFKRVIYNFSLKLERPFSLSPAPMVKCAVFKRI